MKITGVFIGALLIVAITARPESQDDSRDERRPQQQSDINYARINFPRKYKQGRTYVYKYNAQILTGVPQTADHYTGHKLLATVKLAIRRDRRVHMKLADIKILQTNRILPVDLPTVVLERSLFSQLDNREAVVMMLKKLSLPITFEWLLNGTVTRPYTHRHDSYWSINLKKGVMSMLNIDVSVTAEEIRQNNGIWREPAQHEDGIDGRCGVKYSYNRFPYKTHKMEYRNSDDDMISIVKNRDLLNCTEYPWMQHALFPSLECAETRRPMSAQTETRYNATKTQDDFFLRQILTSSQYIYNPEERKNGSIATFVVQQLRFVKQRVGFDFKLSQVDQLRHHQGLQMILPIQEMSLTKSSSAVLKKEARVSLALLLIEYHKDDIKMYDRMREFVETARKMSVEDLKEVITGKLRETKLSSMKSRQMLLELLPKVATKQAIDVIIDLIKDAKRPLSESSTRIQLSDAQTSMLVSRLSGMTFVSHDVMVTNLMELAKRMVRKDQRETYKSLILVVGQLINTRSTRRVPQQSKLSREDVILTPDYIRAFYEHILSRRNSILEKNTKQLTAILSLGNCRLVDPCMDLLEEYIPADKGYQRSVRNQAVVAYSLIAGQAPLRARRLAMPIFLDEKEDVQIRLMSYVVFMRSGPSRSDLRIVQKSMLKEKSQQVRSLIQSYMNGLGKLADNRCMSGVVWNASRVMDDTQQEWFGAQYTRDRIGSFENLKYVLFGLIFSPHSFLPRETALIVYAQAMGLNIDITRIEANFNETQHLLQSVFGPDGSWRKAESVKQLLKALSDQRKKMDPNFFATIKLYEGFYGFDGLSTEATEMLREGSIPLSQSLYSLVTKGGKRQGKFQHTFFADRLSKIATSFGASFSVNHTITGHVKLAANITLKPNLFAKAFGVELKLKHRASIRQQLRAGADLGLVSAFIDANSHIHAPKSQVNTIKLGLVRGNMATKFRVNVNRPLQDTKVLRLGSRLQAVQKISLGMKPEIDQETIQHRSLPAPKQRQTRLLALPSVGLSLRVDRRSLNSTGIADFVRLPFYGPAEMKVWIERDQSVGENRCIDITGVCRTNRVSIEEVVQQVFGESEQLSKREQRKLVQKVGEVYERNLVAVLRLRNFTVQREPQIQEKDQSIRPIGRFGVRVAAHQQTRGLSISAKVEKLRQQRWSWTLYGLSRVSEVPQFEEDRPLQIEKDATAQMWLAILKDNRVVLRSGLEGTVGDFWFRNVQRIKWIEKKVLRSIPDLQKCLQDRKRGRSDSPACLQAWRDINMISRVRLSMNTTDESPYWMKKIPLSVHNLMRSSYGKAHVSSDLDMTDSKSQQKLKLDLQVSPYDQKVFSAWLSAAGIVDRYSNAKSPVTMRNSITRSLKRDVLSNIFQFLYPATCEVVSKRNKLQVRTIDGVDIITPAPLKLRQSGRVVLVQDIDERFQVSEQKSQSHRVTYIRLKNIDHHVSIVVNERGRRRRIPILKYGGKGHQLPFVLKNEAKQVVLRAVREATVRSPLSITIQLPLLGTVIRTHPLVSTVIELDPFFRFNVHGICGDFNAEKAEELLGPKCENLYRNPKDFVDQYTTKLRRPAHLDDLPKKRSMTKFMEMERCPLTRYYLNLN